MLTPPLEAALNDTIPVRLLEQARKSGPRAALFERGDAGWKSISWAEYAALVRRAARALIALGFKSGDTTCILGFNRQEWVIFDVATMMAGGAPAGIYTTCSPPEVQYIVDHSEARFVLVEDRSQWQKIEAERARLPRLEKVVTMRGATVDGDIVLSWDTFLALGVEDHDAELDRRIAGLRADQIATFIYTSGTTGPPKAVMLSHTNLSWTASAATRLADTNTDDTTVSYLPLSHIAEQMFTIHAPITQGYAVYFAQSFERLPENLREVQPTILFGVPRIWEKFHSKVNAKMNEATGLKRRIASWAQGVGRRVTELRNQGKTPSGLLSLEYKAANKLVFAKVKPQLGLGKVRMCVTGAAPISREVLDFFAGLDLTIHEVYGQSEDSGPTTFNTKGATRPGTVGKVLDGTEVKIADDGEIVIRGPHVFLGYYKDEAATNEALVGGWLHSGDLGAFDADGFLSITGRKKEIIITAGGKNIAPKNIEGALRDIPLVSQAVVIGDRRRFLSALITLEPDAAAKFASDNGVDLASLPHDPKLRAALSKAIDEVVNPQFARVEHVRKFTVLPRDLSIDGGEMTPTMKIKRKVVAEHFAAEIEAMYADGDGE